MPHFVNIIYRHLWALQTQENFPVVWTAENGYDCPLPAIVFQWCLSRHCTYSHQYLMYHNDQAVITATNAKNVTHLGEVPRS